MLVSVAYFVIFAICFRNSLCSAIVRAPMNMHNITRNVEYGRMFVTLQTSVY